MIKSNIHEKTLAMTRRAFNQDKASLQNILDKKHQRLPRFKEILAKRYAAQKNKITESTESAAADADYLYAVVSADDDAGKKQMTATELAGAVMQMAGDADVLILAVKMFPEH